MRTDAALGGRKLDTMSNWTGRRLSYLTDEETAVVYSYLHARCRKLSITEWLASTRQNPNAG